MAWLSFSLIFTILVCSCGKSPDTPWDPTNHGDPNLTDGQNLTFANPKQATCLDQTLSASDLRLSDKDIYYFRYPNIFVCSYPYNVSAKLVASTPRLLAYEASRSGVYYIQDNTIFYLPKSASRDAQSASVVTFLPLGVSGDEASRLIVTPGDTVAIVSNLQALFFTYNSANPRNPWSQSKHLTLMPDATTSSQVSALGLTRLDPSLGHIEWYPLASNDLAKTLDCPLCRQIRATDTGVFAVADNGVYFFDGEGKRSLLGLTGANTTMGLQAVSANASGLYVQYRSPDNRRETVSLLSRSGREILICNDSMATDGLVTADQGALVKEHLGYKPWIFFQLIKQ